MTELNSFEEACDTVASQIAELVIQKQHDYGTRNILDFGEYGILVRVNDKVARLKNLLGNNLNPQNEPMVDTWRDIAGYAIVALMLKQGWFTLPLERE